MSAKLSATSISLPYDVVLEIIGDYLNAHLLQVPHIVRDIDCCDRQCINVGLELAPQAARTIMPAPLSTVEARFEEFRALPQNIGPSIIPPTNGNGHNYVTFVMSPETSPEEVSSSQNGTAGKRGRTKYTRELRRRVLELCDDGVKRKDVAAQCNIPESSVYAIRADAAREAKASSAAQG